MASRILGFLLGLLFLVLGALPFIAPLFSFLNPVMPLIKQFYSLWSIGPVPMIPIILALVGLFCIQSAVRDVWPFYG